MLPKIIDNYPLALQVCIYSLDPYIGAHVLEHLLSNGLKEKICAVLVIRLHTIDYTKYGFIYRLKYIIRYRRI
jgi:hypothetical protein